MTPLAPDIWTMPARDRPAVARPRSRGGQCGTRHAGSAPLTGLRRRSDASPEAEESPHRSPKGEPRPRDVDFFVRLCASELGVECVRELLFHPSRKWRFDYAIPDHRIALEVEGGVWTRGRHTRPQGFLGDIDKYNQATLLGWRVFRTTPAQLLRTSTLELLRKAIESPGVAHQ